MGEKKIKELKISLANNEGIIIPYQCFKKLLINGYSDLYMLKNNDKVVIPCKVNQIS